MTNRSDCSCKVGRVADEYGLSGADEWLVADWQDGTSVRELAKTFNEDVVAARMNAIDTSRLTWSRMPVYEAIHTDELDEPDAIEIRRELEREGIDVDTLADDLVSHQSVYRHLTNCLDASKADDPTPEERLETARDRVYALQQRTTLVTESTLESLQRADVTDVGDPDVLVDIIVACRECGRSMEFNRALTDGCDCDTEANR